MLFYRFAIPAKWQRQPVQIALLETQVEFNLGLKVSGLVLGKAR